MKISTSVQAQPRAIASVIIFWLFIIYITHGLNEGYFHPVTLTNE